MKSPSDEKQEGDLDYAPPIAVEHNNDHEGDLESHVDEKWLVSYSDLMTLLFGLFVMLYSMAVEKSGNPNELLAKVSDAAMAREEKSEPAPVSADDIKKLQETIARLEQEKVDLTRSIEAKDLRIAELEKSLEENKLEIEKLREELRLAQEELLKKDQLIAELQSKVPKDSKVDLADVNKQKRELASLKTKLDSLSTLSKEEVDKILQKNKELEEDLKRQKELNLVLSRKLEEGKGRTKFLMIVAKWSTEKHDIDMTVVDSQGKLYDFKNKNQKGTTSRLEIDSRYGPGVEMWRSSEIMEGQYKVQLVLYNNYGNTQNAKVELTVISNMGTKSLGIVELNALDQKKKEFSFNVDGLGKISTSP